MFLYGHGEMKISGVADIDNSSHPIKLICNNPPVKYRSMYSTVKGKDVTYGEHPILFQSINQAWAYYYELHTELSKTKKEKENKDGQS